MIKSIKKSILFTVCAGLMLCIAVGAYGAAHFGAVSTPNSAAASSTNRPNTVVLNNADSLTGFNQGNVIYVTIDRFIKKEGTGSVRFDSRNNFITLSYRGPGVDITHLKENGDVYIEFWFYVLDAMSINSTTLSFVRVGSSNDDFYSFDLMSHVFLVGWNRMSFNLSEAHVMGSPDHSNINRFMFYRAVPRFLTVYFDDIILTNDPLPYTEDDLGIVDTNSIFGSAFRPNPNMRHRTSRRLNFTPLIISAVVFAIALLAALGVVIFLVVKKGGGKKA